MRLRDSYDGSGVPFQGDRTALLRSIPVNARIERATVVVTPFDATRGAEPFAETTAFAGATGTWGATKTVVAGAGGWVEIDFHARRTLASLSGSNLTGTSLQVDFGGVFVELNPAGSVRTPNDPLPFTVNSEAPRLPGLTVTKIKLTNATAKSTTPDVRQVTFRTLASNITLRLGDSAPFWARAGELVAPETSPDFAPLLQAFLAQAKAENGFFVVPLVLHTDTLARLSVSLEIDYLVEQSVLPPGLGEITLPFDLGTRADVPRDVLQIVVPPGSRVAPGGATARVNGVFEPTRLVRETDVAVAPAGSVEVSPALSHAQPVKLSAEAVVSEIDLLFTIKRTAKLQLDIREDFDGKPGETSFLAAPVAQDLPGPVGVASERRDEGETKWLSVRLPSEFQFKAGTTYWLVMQSLEGTFDWKVAPAPAGSVSLQGTDTGGLSWRGETAAPAGGPLRAFFRLRRRPSAFEVPIELEIGEGADAVRLNLDRFQPLGRVDFELDPDDLSNAFNAYLDKSARRGSCAGVEHLANVDFEQWLRVGDARGQASSIPLNLAPLSLAFTPDGSQAYVGYSGGDGESGSLGVVDVACGAPVEPEITLDDLTPDILALNPAGTRAYVSDGARFQIIDATARRALAPAVELPTGNALGALAVSPDGARLYAAVTSIPIDVISAGAPRHTVVGVGAQQVEQFVAQGGGHPEGVIESLKTLPLATAPVALAVSPDGSRLYVTTFERNVSSRSGGQGELHILDALTLQPPGDVIIVGNEPEGIALSADGKRAVVLNSGDNTLSVINTTTRATVATLDIGHTFEGPRPYAVALSPEGTRAFVALRRSGGKNDDTLKIIDVDRGIVETIDAGTVSTALALTAQGDQLYVADAASNDDPPGADSLISIQMGTRLPAEWDLTSGTVSPVCYPEPQHLVAQLGSFDPPPTESPTTISQVVPVAELCTYEFSFEAIATQPFAVAEVFWINDECGLLRTDTVPVEALPPQSAAFSPQLLSAFQVRDLKEKPALLLHRRRLDAPAGATQAEVRFNVPHDVVAFAGSVSLKSTGEALENTDLGVLAEGLPAAWEVLPAVAPGVSLSASGSEVQLRNNGSAAAELVQSVKVEGNRPFALELQGSAESSATARANPTLELRWFKGDNSQAGAAVVLDLSPGGFASAAAAGTTPPDAARAEVHLIVPPGTTQKVRNISLQFQPVLIVPVAFVAQAPGELSLFDWRVAFEQAEAKTPPPPAKGLCVATPPGRLPGRTHEGSHYCPCCGAEQPADDEPTPASSPAGRPASVETCSACGTKSVRFGGRGATVAQPLATQLPPARANAATHAEHVKPAAETEGAGAITTRPFAAVVGIGPVRSMKLSALGINSVEMLAAATPEDVMKVAGITPKLAANFIKQANDLLPRKRGPQPPTQDPPTPAAG